MALALYAAAFEQAGALQHFEAFASFNGPDFYGLPRNTGESELVKHHQALITQCRTVSSPKAAGRHMSVAAWAHDALGHVPPLLCADKVTLQRRPWTVPDSYEFGDSVVVPMWAGQECPWTVAAA